MGCVLQGMDGKQPAVGAASSQHTLHAHGCGAPAGTAGPEAAAEAGQGDRHLSRSQRALHTVLW